MVVDGHGQNLLGAILANHVLIKRFLDLFGAGQAVTAALGVFLDFLPDDVVAKIDAFVADKNGRACNQLADFLLALAAEGAVQQLAVTAPAVRLIGHVMDPRNNEFRMRMQTGTRICNPDSLREYRGGYAQVDGDADQGRFRSTWSMRP
jgi:hypothetical protein